MKKLAPSILSADFFKLGQEVSEAIEDGADWMHIDVMDSHFVPPLTFGAKIVADIKKNIDVFCDVHLMVTNPENHIMPFIEAGADLVNFQIEPVYHGDRFINWIKEHDRMAGITICPGTSIDSIKHYLPLIDMILVMSVNPGYSGQKCIEYNFEKVKELTRIREEKGYNYIIQIDGGISLKNIDIALEAGVESVVAGSGFFNASRENRKKFASIIHNA